MMDAMSGDPEDRSAFERERTAGGDEVFKPLGHAVSAMGQQAVVAHADADVDGEEVHDGEGGEVLPGEEEERGDGEDVEDAHSNGSNPVDLALLMLAAHAKVLLDLTGDFSGEQASGFDSLGGAGRGADAGKGLNLGFGGLRCQERRGHISLFWPRVLFGVLARECP